MPTLTPSQPEEAAGAGPERQALQEALAGLLAAVARLAVARGAWPAVRGGGRMLRLAFVQAAARAHPGLPEHRKVSRISTTTGINRREVTRLTQATASAAPRGRSVASEVFTRWRTQAAYQGTDGLPRSPPRLGDAPSFESLVQSVTRDVHPRSLLDDLRRLGLVQWDEAADRRTWRLSPGTGRSTARPGPCRLAPRPTALPVSPRCRPIWSWARSCACAWRRPAARAGRYRPLARRREACPMPSKPSSRA